MKHRTFLRFSGAAAATAGLVWVLAGPGSLSVAAPSAQESPIEKAMGDSAKYVETRQLIGKLKADYKVSRDSMEATIDLTRDQIADLREALEEKRSRITEDDDKRARELELKEQAQAATAGLEERVAAMEQRLIALQGHLPLPLTEKIRSLTERFPEDPESAEKGLALRFLDVAAVLNEIDKFHGEVSTWPEDQVLADGKRAMVTSVYFGISQGYYVDGSGQLAASGRATDEGWTWTQEDGIAEGVQTAVKILNNEVGASFVSLPVQIN